MTTPHTAARIRGVAPDGKSPDIATCPACPHLVATHAAIGARFCRATTANTLSRGCVCAEH